MTKMNWFIIRNDDVVSNSQPCGFLTHLVIFCNSWFIAGCIFYNNANGNYFLQFKFVMHDKETQGLLEKGDIWQKWGLVLTFTLTFISVK